jgi:soluble lytic murein transglycosylase-like protein
MKNMILTLVVGVVVFIFAFYVQVDVDKKTTPLASSKLITRESPPCVQMFYSIEKHATEYNIPKDYAYGVAYSETRYEGPFQWDYDHSKISSAGAQGPMQVMYATAKMLFPDKKFTEKDLRSDIDFNVECSMKLLRRLYDKYGDWKTVFGAYNTGKPLVNGYAMAVFSYKRK